MASRLGELIVSSSFALEKSHLEYCVQLWWPQPRKDLLEQVQYRDTKKIAGPGGPLLLGQAEGAAFVQPGGRKTLGKPYCLPLIFLEVLNLRRVRLHIRKTFFMMEMVKHWNRLPSKMVNAPSLETLNVKLDGALGNLI